MIMDDDDPFPWDQGVFDAHCHPTDTMSSITDLAAMRTRTLTIMATRADDQALVASVAAADTSKTKVIPAFGWHPWFSHHLYDDTTTTSESPRAAATEKRRHYRAVLVIPKDDDDNENDAAAVDAFIDKLPTPQPLSAFVAQTRRYMQDHAHALGGEMGLDKAFRLPQHTDMDINNDNEKQEDPKRVLSPYRVSMDHQRRVLAAQLQLAGEMQRPVSVHGVQAAGALFDALFGKGGASPTIVDPLPPRICLHSFTGSAQTLQQYLASKKGNASAAAVKVYFSFSMLVNYGHGGHAHARKKHVVDEVLRACPADRILVESDFHAAGAEMDALLEAAYRRVCEAKGWTLRHGVEQIRKNYNEFVYGSI